MFRNIINLFKNIDYSVKEEEDNEKYIPFKCISLNDLNYIKENNIPCTEIAKFQDGWHFGLPDLKLYEHYEPKILKENINEILYNALFFRDKDKFHRWDYFLGNLPMILDIANYDCDWKKLFEIFTIFLEISLIKWKFNE